MKRFLPFACAFAFFLCTLFLTSCTSSLVATVFESPLEGRWAGEVLAGSGRADSVDFVIGYRDGVLHASGRYSLWMLGAELQRTAFDVPVTGDAAAFSIPIGGYAALVGYQAGLDLLVLQMPEADYHLVRR